MSFDDATRIFRERRYKPIVDVAPLLAEIERLRPGAARREKNREAAANAVARAVEKGTLTRPLVCEQCGRAPGVNRRGQPKIQFHHHLGYARKNWLKGRWLCTSHHRQAHSVAVDEHSRIKEIEKQLPNYAEVVERWYASERGPKLVWGILKADGTFILTVGGDTWAVRVFTTKKAAVAASINLAKMELEVVQHRLGRIQTLIREMQIELAD